MIQGGVPARLHVRLFGEPCVHHAAKPARLSPRQLALVVIVYGHGRKGLLRPRAAQFLWGTDPTPDIRHRLRQLLAEVRCRLGAHIIVTDRDRLRAGPDVGSDLATFEAGFEGGSLIDAAMLVRSGFAELPARSVVDDYDRWRASTEQGLIRSLRVEAVTRWDQANRGGDWSTAKDAAEALYALDPSDREAVLKMIDVLGRQGLPESAERVFEEYRSSLPHEAEPTPRLLDAMRRVRRLGAAALSGVGKVEHEVPMIGRREALGHARGVFDKVASGQFGFVLIGGESGIGKTRMLRELWREGVLREFRCLVAQAVELERRLPLNPLLDALKPVDLGPHLDAIGRPWNAVVGTTLPAGALVVPADAPPPIEESALPRRLLDAYYLLFESLAVEQPTLLFLDDLQWADATTVAALQFMQRRWNRGRFGVISTIRPELVRPDDALAKYLAPRTAALCIDRIDLAELSSAEALKLVEYIGQGDIGRELAQQICALAGLHPLYLTELARDYLSGRLRLPALPIHEVTIPVSLKQMLETRFACVGEAAMKVAGVLAVAARPLRLGKAAHLAGLSLHCGVDAAEELRRARLIEYDRDQVRVTHELFRSAIYRRISEPRRAIHHRAVAEHIEAGSRSPAPGELATHYSRAGETVKAAEYGWAAAERAMESGAVAEAAHFFQLVTENESEAPRKAEATAAQARALHLARDINRANPLLEVAATRLYAVGEPAKARRLEVTRVEGLAEVGAASLGDLLERLAHIKAQAQAREDWEGVALALDTELHLLHRRGDVGRIPAVFRQMRSVAEGGPPEAKVLCLGGLALGVLFGDPEEALLAGREAVALTEHYRSYRLRALLRLTVVLQYRGLLEMPGSKPVVREARELAEKSGDVLLRFSIENNLAVAALDAGDLDSAEVQMLRARDLAGSADMDLYRFIQANNRAELAMAQHAFRAARDAYAEAASYAGTTTPAYMMDLVHAGMGLCALETGDFSGARRREHAIRSPPSSWHFDPTMILAFKARLLHKRQQLDQAVQLLDAAADNLESRLVLAWLKVRALQVRLLKKLRSARARELANEALVRAADLRLAHRTQEFSRLLHPGQSHQAG